MADPLRQGKGSPTRGMRVDIQWRPTVKQLGEYEADYREQFGKAMEKITDKVVRRATAAAPGPHPRSRTPGALKSTIRTSTTKTYGTIAVGFKRKSGAPYAARVHWGRITKAQPRQNPRDWFLWRQVYPKATIKKSGPMAPWIVKEVQAFVNKAIEDFNRKGGPKQFKANKAPA